MLQYSNDNSAWATLISSQTCTSTGGTAFAWERPVNYVRIQLPTKSGSGTVTLKVGETIPAGLKRHEVEARVHAAINALELAPQASA